MWNVPEGNHAWPFKFPLKRESEFDGDVEEEDAGYLLVMVIIT